MGYGWPRCPRSTTHLGVLLPRRIAWMLEGRRPHQNLEGMRRMCATPMVDSIIVEHFAFGKRVWTRNAPTARARAAICVQRFDDSLNPAIHITYRVSRRSSSLREPRDPSLKGGCWFCCCLFKNHLVDVGENQKGKVRAAGATQKVVHTRCVCFCVCECY